MAAHRVGYRRVPWLAGTRILFPRRHLAPDQHRRAKFLRRGRQGHSPNAARRPGLTYRHAVEDTRGG